MIITIDGKKVETGEAPTVLAAALTNGIFIPTLCHHESLSDYGACRLCLVETVRRGHSRVTASCTLPVREGLEIVTGSDRVIRLRRLVMELILASCPASEAVIEMAERLGARKDRLKSDPESDCIRCGLCVRACAELSGSQAINFAHRGVNRTITTPFDAPNPNCLICGACIFVCPTGSRLLDLAKISGEEPQKLLSRFDAGLGPRAAVHLPLRQSLPNVPAIDRTACLHLNRDGCGICEKVCAADAIRFDDQDRDEDIEVGAVIIAPGSDEFHPYEKHEFGYGRFSNVISSIQFERILSASGPFQGHVARPSDHREPKKTAFLQCIGSRDISSGHEYCSAVCCMYAIKEAIIAKEHLKTIEPAIFFMDLRAYGKDFDRYYEKAQTELGIRFIRSRVSGIEPAPGSDNLILTYASEEGKVTREEFDLVVLSVGLEPRLKHRELARKLGLRLNESGFIDTSPFSPHRTSQNGILVAGTASGPKDIPETVSQASGAAADASELLAESRGAEITPAVFPPARDVSGEEPRIGLFICNCGINIGGVVDVPAVVEYAKKLPAVAYAEENLFTCSQDTQEKIKKVISEHKLNRVVVASCSPRTHEPLFQETLQAAGLNAGLFEMANIRDQCSWIHLLEPAEATLKAKDLVRMAAAKARLLEPLEKVSLPVTPAGVVIGGGLAGMTAALSLARQGFEVSLVEKERELGGNLKNARFTPEGKPVQAYLQDLIDQVRNQAGLSVITGAGLKNVEGYVGNYLVRVEASGLDPDKASGLVPDKAGGRQKPLELKAGAIIVATGAQESRPEEYLLGQDRRVITQSELEQLIAEDGRRKSKVGRKKSEIKKQNTVVPSSDLRRPSSVVMIQCVGSRDDKHPYCSRVCCLQAVKNALALKEISPETEIFILYRDIRTYGLSEYYYRKAREKGVVFIRYDPEAKPRVEKRGRRLRITVSDPILGRTVEIEPDLVALSPAIVPRPDAEALARMLKVPLNQDGFFLEAHVKLRPVDFATEGIFLAGMAHSPKTISESISQAKAAAARAATILSQENYLAAPIVAQVNEEICAGCGLCVAVCSYNAPGLVELEGGKKVSRVNVALCKGCGSCAAACPSGAMEQLGFKSRQTREMVKAALEE